MRIYYASSFYRSTYTVKIRVGKEAKTAYAKLLGKKLLNIYFLKIVRPCKNVNVISNPKVTIQMSPKGTQKRQYYEI